MVGDDNSAQDLIDGGSGDDQFYTGALDLFCADDSAPLISAVGPWSANVVVTTSPYDGMPIAIG